ncbi:MAG: hypothetical protein LBC82_02915 [Oscillospiraceae bacterium]|jgi:hypothetical protein|nr:hypothetical protein [Oscillospiraceae bacterium]
MKYRFKLNPGGIILAIIGLAGVVYAVSSQPDCILTHSIETIFRCNGCGLIVLVGGLSVILVVAGTLIMLEKA